jgi:hypothetical protein
VLIVDTDDMEVGVSEFVLFDSTESMIGLNFLGPLGYNIAPKS